MLRDVTQSLFEDVVSDDIAYASGSGWWLPGASLDLDFVNNRALGSPSLGSLITCTRASAGYAEDASGNWILFGNNAYRITNKGLLIEEARTNSIRNNSMQGAVVGVLGSGGALPTNWNYGAGGLTVSVEGLGTENGIDYIDIRYQGTATATTATLFFEGSAVVTASQGQTWAMSMFCKLIAAPLALPVLNNSLLEQTGGVTNTSASQAFVPTTASLGSQRLSLVRTTVTAGMDNVRPRPRFDLVNGQAYDFTLRVGWPQLELGAFATSPVRTTNAAATRSADVVTVNNPGNYGNMTEGSVCAEWTDILGHLSTDRRVFGFGISSQNNIRLIASTSGGGKVNYIVSQGNVSQASLVSTNTIVANTTYKAAARWKQDDFAVRFSSSLGAQPANDTSGAIPDTGALLLPLGTSIGTANYLNGYMRRFTLFPTAQNDNRLNGMVA